MRLIPMIELQTKISTDTWVAATWEEYIQIVDTPAYEKVHPRYPVSSRNWVYPVTTY